jgi:6-phosphofructokinase 1
MIRLRRDDFDDPDALATYAATCGITPEQFRQQFESSIAREPPALELTPQAGPGAD